MIESGWIFPDGTEYSCGDDNWMFHDLVVIHFIQGLKFLDSKSFEIIKKEIDDLWDKQGPNQFYANYAIRRLGWIKVGSSIWHDIRYAGYDWQHELIRTYEENGYMPRNMYLSSTSYLSLKCNVLRTIGRGK